MEGSSLKSRKLEARKLLKGCFKNPVFSFVPFEIWRYIISFEEAKTLVTVSKTCWGFKELVDDFGERNLNLALLLRKEDQIVLALKYLLKCAENGNARAMFHLGYGSYMSGWRLKQDDEKAAVWLKRSAEAGDGAAMAWYSYFLLFEIGGIRESETGEQKSWAQKALSSKDLFGVGCCEYWKMETPGGDKEAFMLFQAAANGGCEYGQNWLGQFYQYVDKFEIGIDLKKALYWYTKSAEQGNCQSQFTLGCLYRDGKGCEKDEDKAIIFLKKAAKQGNRYAITYLIANNKY